MLTLLPALALAAPIHGDRLVVHSPVGFAPAERLAPGVYVDHELPSLPGWYLVTVPSDPLNHLEAVERHPLVDHADPDVALTLANDPTEEPAFPDQWALESLPSCGGWYDADLDATAAWDAGATGAGVVVAIVDTGVDLDHPDLAPAWWTNPGEIAGNGIDDDGNGYVDDVHGIDASAGTGDPNDSDGHGTSCAGLVGARADGRGTVGLAPEVELMGVRIFSDDGGFASTAAEGLAYAALEGADVLSNSWHYGQREEPVVTAGLQVAADEGALVIAAAGNTWLDADVEGFYPARTPMDEVVSVGGSTRRDEPLHFPGLWGSAYGAETVDLNAPAEGVQTTLDGGGYHDFSGTSAAAPLAAATAALVWSAAPELTALEVKEALLAGTEADGSVTVSGGRLSAGRSVAWAQGELLWAPEIAELPSSDGVVLLTAVGPDDAEWTWWTTDAGFLGSDPAVRHTPEPGPQRVVLEGVTPDGVRGQAVLELGAPLEWREEDDLTVEPPHHQQHFGFAELDAGDVAWTRLHFERIELTEDGWDQGDWVAVYDGDGVPIWSATGAAEDVWTPALRGGKHLVLWQFTSSRPGWGFSLDRAEVAEHVDRSTDPPEAPKGGCATLPGGAAGWWIAPWLAVALGRRRRSGRHALGPRGRLGAGGS